MKTLPKFLLYFFVTISFIVICSALQTGISPVFNNFAYADSTGDTDEDDPSIFRASDLGGMFNERGFMKSGSAGVDGNEIINDFNGNLMYSIPIAKGKGEGDLSYEVSLNYNGNVNHQIITSDQGANEWTFGQLHQYNFTSPEWIFSFNGLAVQVLNYESYYFTRPDNNNEANGNYARLLIPGYQLTGMLNTPSSLVFDKITILLGDGSTETLENTSGYSYQGTYITKNKNSYLKARVFNGDSTGSCRTMYLMKGDGLTYIYVESYLKFKDNQVHTGMPGWFKPKAFLLTSVKDRFGKSYSLNYDFHTGQDDSIGRPWLQSCPGVNFQYQSIWGTYLGLAANTIDGRFLFYTDQFGIATEQVHRPMLQKILNPSGQQMIFNYEPYTRIGTNIYSQSGSYMTVHLGGSGRPLYRISSLTNFEGGTKHYYYSGPNSMQMSYIPGTNEAGVHSSSDYYKGQGRDFYFSNMLDSVITNDGTQNTKFESFQYTYTLSGNRDYNNVWIHPIDTTDEYKTTKVTSSLNHSNDNSTPPSVHSEKTYRNYAIRAIEQGETMDYNGTLQIVKDDFYKGSDQNPTRTQTFSYYTGNAGEGGSQDFFNGKFLTKESSEYFTSGSARRTTDFWYLGGGDSLLLQKDETDPLGRTTVTNYSNTYIAPFTVFKDGSYRVGEGELYDSVYIYIIQQPKDVTLKRGNTILKRDTLTYYNPSSVTGSAVDGYPGQLHEEKELDPANGNMLREKIYSYYNQDTIGRYVYNTTTYSNTHEGNIKQITDADGNISKYYYDIISHSEDAQYTPCNEGEQILCPPNFTFHVEKDNGADSVGRTGWRDFRLPSRIDQYVNGQKYLSTYQLYDAAGNPYDIVNNNNFESRVDYGKYYRASKITLPYDFNTALPDTIPTIDTTILPFSYTSISKQWGFKHDDSSNYCAGNYDLSSDISYIFNSEHFFIDVAQGLPNSPQETHISAITQFADSNFNHISSVDSAFLELSAFFISPAINNSNTSDYSLVITPYSVLRNVGCNNGESSSLSLTQGTSTASFSGLNFTTLDTCIHRFSYTDSVYFNNHRRLNVTNLISQNISSDKLNLEGISLKLAYNGTIGNPEINFFLQFLKHCDSTNLSHWLQNSAPKLILYGKKTYIDTFKTVKYNSGTVVYNYDDIHNQVSVLSKLDKPSDNRYKHVDNLFDGFGKLKQSRQFYSSTGYDSSLLSYNYLDQKARTFDGRNDSTMFSYNEFGTLSKTKNCDTSSSAVSESFLSSFTNAFASFSFAHEQVFYDETGREFDKYFDAAGNLIREVKYVSGSNGSHNISHPFDPDTTIRGDAAPGDISLVTDYQYDDLNRVINVKTPEGKHITYGYDALGRVTSRITSDAGMVRFAYDKNNNLILSQDANQAAVSSNLYTGRTYDGLNRLLTIGDTHRGLPNGPQDSNGDTLIVPDTTVSDNPASDSLYIINCYDTLSQAPVSGVFDNFIPYDFYSTKNNTKGALAATAYRTNLTDAWSFKFYRYDARGRVIKMWNNLAGMDSVKTTEYRYNSQNQVINMYYDAGKPDWKYYKYTYDDAGRLKDADIMVWQVNRGIGEDNPLPPDDDNQSDDNGTWSSVPFTSYTYNQNSQIDTLSLNNGARKQRYAYNNRNWVLSFYKPGGSPEFAYNMTYNPNGNIRSIYTSGTYSSNFGNSYSYGVTYIYDKSNRLLKSEFGNTDSSFDMTNAYDGDGNIAYLKRMGASGNVIDSLNYNYYTSTDKLNFVTGSTTQFTYDANGNVTGDTLNHIFGVKSDYRNLLKEFRIWRVTPGGTGIVGGSTSYDTYLINYLYDEAGNRFCKKIYKWSETTIDTISNGTDNSYDTTMTGDYNNGTGGTSDNGYNIWRLQTVIYYVHDVSGKEIAIYNSNNLQQWNVFGADNVGKIDSAGGKYFYLKDHLGTIRAIIDTNNTVVAANDYDAWGYPLDQRTYNASVTSQNYKFTSKERDLESALDGVDGYDYFGARFYNSRIANWTSVDPLFEKHIGFTPYNYVLRNPIRLIDPDGKQVDQHELALRIQELIREHPELFLIAPEIPGIGPEITIALGIMSLPIPPLPISDKASIFGIEKDGNLISPFPTQTIDVRVSKSESIDLHQLEVKGAKEYVERQGYAGEHPVERFKEDVLQQEGISKKNAKKFDIYEDKKSGNYFLKPKKEFEKQFKNKIIQLD